MNIKTQFLLASLLCITSTKINAQITVQTSSPRQLIEDFHSVFGNHHSRAVHAKGIILEGDFNPANDAKKLSKAFHLQAQKSKVIVRFSDFTGIPDIPDNVGLANPRGFAIKFKSAAGSTTDIVSHSFNGFPTENSDQFHDLLVAIAKSGKDAEKPTDLDRYLNSHPIAKRFLTTQKSPASFGTVKYFGVNSFKFINEKGESHFVRYQFVPENGEQLLTEAQIAQSGPEYLFDELKARIAKQPIVYKLYVEIAEKGDEIENPAISWPSSRKKVLLGTITIKNLAANTVSEDKALFFIPNNIPDGIETADPMLNFRSKAYPISVKERQ